MNDPGFRVQLNPATPAAVPPDINLARTVLSPARGRFETGGLPSSATTGLPREDLSADMLIRGVPRAAIDGADAPVLGGVALLAKLGQGGMGKVYVGFHLRLEKEVAVKVVWADMTERIPELIPRFKREAKLAAKVHSPFLVAVLDVDESSGLHFMIMEFVPGVTAARYSRECSRAGHPGLPESDALEICIAATRGLAAAHAKNIIHRDVKPDNILIPRNEFSGVLQLDATKLADLGIARQESSNDSQLTLAQRFMGTPGFASPEQSDDASTCGKPADVFSMGATLFALLAGREPFYAASSSSGEERLSWIVDAVKNLPHTPIRELRSDVTRETAAVLDRCLQKHPAQRFADASELLAALQDAQRALGPGGQFVRDPGQVRAAPSKLDSTTELTNDAHGTEPSLPQTRSHVSPQQAELDDIQAIRARTPRFADGRKTADNARTQRPRWLIASAAILLLAVVAFAFASAEGWIGGSSKSSVNPVPSKQIAIDVKPPRLGEKPKEIAPPIRPPGTENKIDPSVQRERETPEKRNAADGPKEAASATLTQSPAQPVKGPGTDNPPAKTLALDLGKGVKIDLVLVPGGSFKMGSPDSEEGRDEFETQHDVALDKPFYMGAFEVTQEQYAAIMGENPSAFKGPTLPVENVSWVDAVNFCRKLREKTGDKAALPTEAQWEYACRAGTATPFNTGETIAADQANYDGEDKYGKGVPGENRRKTTPAGSFKPNAFGLYDMHGNVLEWCGDWFAENYYRTSDSTDPRGPATGGNRVARGGSWSQGPRLCRCAYRSGLPENTRQDNLGFRIVIALE